MENKELRAKLIELRNQIQDYLDNIAMDEADEARKPAKGKGKDNG
jgi:hypothetical protein